MCSAILCFARTNLSCWGFNPHLEKKINLSYSRFSSHSVFLICAIKWGHEFWNNQAWFTFAALCWALWNIRNKLAMEGTLISTPADAMFKMSIYMQSWRVLVRQRDRELLDEVLAGVRRLHARMRAGAEDATSPCIRLCIRLCCWSAASCCRYGFIYKAGPMALYIKRTPRHRGGGVISMTLNGYLCSFFSRSSSLSGAKPGKSSIGVILQNLPVSISISKIFSLITKGDLEIHQCHLTPVVVC